MRAWRWRLTEGLRNRRGATLVLVSVALVALVGMTGIAVDMSRLYTFKAELQVSADAAALAAITEVGVNQPTRATEVGLAYIASNTVDGLHDVQADALDIEPGTYNFETNQFVPNGYVWNSGVTAVRATAEYPAPLLFGGLINRGTHALQARSVAVRGYVGATDCLKPFAVSYQTLLDKLYGPGVKSAANEADSLTGADITTLTNMSYPANAISLLQGNQDPVTPGNIAQVVTYTPDYGTGNMGYRKAIIGATCSDLPIGPGTWLETDPGGGSGQTKGALKEFCELPGNGGTAGNPQNFTCLGQPKMRLAIWDINNGASGANLEYRVKYVGVFAVVCFQSGNPGGGGGNGYCGVPKVELDQVIGYFSSMSISGGFSSRPTPIIRPGGVIVE